MKQFIDYIPLLVFFTFWAMDERAVSIAGFDHSIGGVFSAAEFLLAASLLVYGSLFVYQKRLDKFQWITLVAVVLFCTFLESIIGIDPTINPKNAFSSSSTLQFRIIFIE